MALEDLTGTKYIDDLNSANPAAGDNVSEGDDHIRGIKNVLKTTFPNIDGAINATDTELNYVDGVTSAVQTQLDAKLPKAGGTMTGDLILGDDVKLEVGSESGGDLQIYHDASNSYIDEVGTGKLMLRSNNHIRLGKYTGEEMIDAIADGAVTLYHDNSAKIATTANGVTVTGTAVATTDTDTSNTGSVTLDFAAKQNFVLTLTGNVTLANPSTEQVGQSGFITFIQDGTGSRTVSLGTDYETAGGAGLTLTSTASATDIVPYVVVASGRILLGTPQLAFA